MKETSIVRKRVPRRQRLVEIGMDLFGHRSYEEISIDDIAAMADISKGLLYYYFPTKHDFYIAVIRSNSSTRRSPTQVLSQRNACVAA